MEDADGDVGAVVVETLVVVGQVLVVVSVAVADRHGAQHFLQMIIIMRMMIINGEIHSRISITSTKKYK